MGGLLQSETLRYSRLKVCATLTTYVGGNLANLDRLAERSDFEASLALPTTLPDYDLP